MQIKCLLFLLVNSIALFVMLWYFGMLFSRGGWLWLTAPMLLMILVLLKHALMMRVSDWRILELLFAPRYWYISFHLVGVFVCVWVNLVSMSVNVYACNLRLQFQKGCTPSIYDTDISSLYATQPSLKGDLIYLCMLFNIELSFNIWYQFQIETSIALQHWFATFIVAHSRKSKHTHTPFFWIIKIAIKLFYSISLNYEWWKGCTINFRWRWCAKSNFSFRARNCVVFIKRQTIQRTNESDS